MHLRPVHDRTHPATSTCSRNFAFPHEVIDDPSLSRAEKRAILAEWASDKSAVESYPTLRRLAGTTFPVTFSSIRDAMRKLDETGPIVGDESDAEGRQLGDLVVANFARSRRRDGVPQ